MGHGLGERCCERDARAQRDTRTLQAINRRPYATVGAPHWAVRRQEPGDLGANFKFVSVASGLLEAFAFVRRALRSPPGYPLLLPSSSTPSRYHARRTMHRQRLRPCVRPILIRVQ